MAYAARFLIVASFALALSVGAAMAAEEYSPLAPPDPPVLEPPVGLAEIPPAPLGLDINGTTYSLLSNKTWKGSKFVKLIQRADPKSYYARQRQTYSYIWAPSCLPTAQKVIFTKNYYLPGPAKNFEADMAVTKSYAIKQIRVFINGKFAFKVDNFLQGGYFYTVILKTEDIYPKLFQNGNNEVTVEVTKLADTATYKVCKGVPLGFAFELRGEFSADLQMNGAGTDFEYAYHAKEGATGGAVEIRRPVSNKGPSGVYRATYSVSISGSGSRITQLVLAPKVPPDYKVCQRDANFHSLECAITRWGKGEARIFEYIGAVGLSPSGAEGSYIQVVRGISSPTPDPNSANNTRIDTIYICYPGDTYAKCSLPPPP